MYFREEIIYLSDDFSTNNPCLFLFFFHVSVRKIEKAYRLLLEQRFIQESSATERNQGGKRKLFNLRGRKVEELNAVGNGNLLRVNF